MLAVVIFAFAAVVRQIVILELAVAAGLASLTGQHLEELAHLPHLRLVRLLLKLGAPAPKDDAVEPSAHGWMYSFVASPSGRRRWLGAWRIHPSGSPSKAATIH